MLDAAYFLSPSFMATKDWANTRYSDLAGITANIVSGLRVAWRFSTGVVRGDEDCGLGS